MQQFSFVNQPVLVSNDVDDKLNLYYSTLKLFHSVDGSRIRITREYRTLSYGEI